MRPGRGSAALAAVLLLAACTSGSTRHASTPHASTPHASTSPPPSSTSSASSRPAPSGHSRPAADGPRTVTILGSGDVLIHPPLWHQAHADARAEGRSGYDFAPMYASIAPDVHRADLAICEMETPLAPPGGPFAGWPDFSAPPQVLTALRGVGYRSCTTASNHTLDQGYAGLKRTLDELDAAGLRHTGSARTRREADTPLIVTTAQGVHVGQLAYSFNFNGHEPSAGRAWEANLISAPAILAAAHRLKRAGADVVVVSLHWGTEYDHLATADQRALAHRLLASPDVDLILGDHAHVVQPAERIDGKWVFYCMGNQISRHQDPIAAGREGVMPLVTFTETAGHRFRVTSARAIPTWMQDDPQLRLVDLPRALASGAATADERAARAAIVHDLDAYGAQAHGLVIE